MTHFYLYLILATLTLATLLAALHYRRAMICHATHATRANVLRATVDALTQERWEYTVRAAKVAQRDRRMAGKVRVLRATVQHLNAELDMNADAMDEATETVERAQRMCERGVGAVANN